MKLAALVRQFAEEKSATPGQVALACDRSIDSRLHYKLSYQGSRGFAKRI
jgi:hypothetical protein